MVNRIEKLSKNKHLFVFGARGTGKTTLLESLFKTDHVLWINLLTETDEIRFGKHPDELSKVLQSNSYDYVIIDEIQKYPKLLDIVHLEIENKKSKKTPFFILTGSSARKLKRNGANMLGGRAITFNLYPLTHIELGDKFNIQNQLQYGSLPMLLKYEKNSDKEDFLKSYVQNYLKEEVLIEQLVRQVEPFKDFLEVAAQMNGEPINYSKISRDVNTSDQTIKTFFQILEDTLVGFHLKSFHRSIRKQQKESPKFYFFDTGVVRALNRKLKLPLEPRTSDFGNAFEHFIILEIYRLCNYHKNDYRLSYIRSKDDVEVDIVIERPGKPDLLVEIKSTIQVDAADVKSMASYQKDWDQSCEAILLSLDPFQKEFQNVKCFFWQDGIKQCF
jgi:predicted AAA+ superfamily ATPase